MKFGICNEIFQNWKLEGAMAFAKGAGYDGIEIAPWMGVEISGIHWVLVQAEGMYLNHPDSEVRARTAKYFCDLVNFCSDLGGKIIVVGSPKQRNVMEGVTFDQAWQWATETFCDSLKRAEDRGITICFEPLAPSETNFINTAADGIRFAK